MSRLLAISSTHSPYLPPGVSLEYCNRREHSVSPTCPQAIKHCECYIDPSPTEAYQVYRQPQTLHQCVPPEMYLFELRSSNTQWMMYPSIIHRSLPSLQTTKELLVSLQTKAHPSFRHVSESGKLLGVIKEKGGKLQLAIEPNVTKHQETGMNSRIEESHWFWCVKHALCIRRAYTHATLSKTSK